MDVKKLLPPFEITRIDPWLAPYAGEIELRMNAFKGHRWQLVKDAIIEAPLVLKDGKAETPAIRVPEALADILSEVDNANRLAAKAAFGDREALREYVETDPAMDGLDRLYCLDVVEALIKMHEDVLTRF